MGVKGLQSYIDYHCPSVTRRVSIAEMAQDHAKMYNRQPILAVDGMSVLYRLYKMDNLEWLYGGQWRQYVENLRLFVECFRNAGIEPIFFFDGLVEDRKKREWIDRRTEKLKDVKKIFDHLVQHNSYPDERLSQLPTSFATMIRFALTTKLRCTVINTVEDGDIEVARFALSNVSCFAILSQDTDFMIFNTKPYLSVAHLNLGALETMLYDREMFAAHVGVDVYHLPMLACLLGNDIVPVDSLRTMHKQLVGTSAHAPTYMVIPLLANFIMGHVQVNSNPNNLSMVLQISRKLGVDNSTLLQGIQYYTSITLPPKLKKKPKTGVPSFFHDAFLDKHRCTSTSSERAVE